jgi:pimeloyl-ACP methyl ester carboxylesterase
LGLLDHLGLASAHIVGASLGGMVAQILAINAPHRVRSLVSIMSTTGNPLKGQPSFSMLPRMLRSIPEQRAAFVATFEEMLLASGSQVHPPDRDWLRTMLQGCYDRGFSVNGHRRQLAAVLAAPNRASKLAKITCPTLVIHGTADRLISVSGGRATARAIPGSHFLELQDMGHDFPTELWPEIHTAITLNTRRA